MIKAVIFDFDGVVIDTESIRFNHLKSILKRFDYDLKDNDFEKSIGKKTRHFLKEIFPKITSDELDKIMQLRRELQFKQIKDYNLIPGLVELLRFLKAQNIKIAISTGSKMDFIKEILKINSLYAYFDLIVSGEMFLSSKPNPECYQVTLKELGLKPDEVIVLEDAVVGIVAAKKAGCKVFAIQTYFGEKQLEDAYKIFPNHLGILNFIKKNFKSIFG